MVHLEPPLKVVQITKIMVAAPGAFTTKGDFSLFQFLAKRVKRNQSALETCHTAARKFESQLHRKTPK